MGSCLWGPTKAVGDFRPFSKDRYHRYKYDPNLKQIEILGIPVAHNYIQTIALDKKRKIVYGFTFPVEKFFKYDLRTNKTMDFGYIRSGPHISTVDDDGNLWGTWGPNYNIKLFKYNPDEDQMTMFDFGLPKIAPGDTGDIDGIVNGGDGYLYIGTGYGALVRFNPRTVELKYLGKPWPETRLPALPVGSDGLLYGCGGTNYNTGFFAYDREGERFIDLGPVYDPDLNISCYRAHHISVTEDGVIYGGETDNPDRCGYLWECKVKL